MADPAEKSPQETNPGDIENDRDLDADMEDPPQDTTAHTQDPSSSTDHEPTQTETQPTSSLPHQNRKDTTLREFLSKMDDYAPIVRRPTVLAMLEQTQRWTESFPHPSLVP